MHPRGARSEMHGRHLTHILEASVLWVFLHLQNLEQLNGSKLFHFCFLKYIFLDPVKKNHVIFLITVSENNLMATLESSCNKYRKCQGINHNQEINYHFFKRPATSKTSKPRDKRKQCVLVCLSCYDKITYARQFRNRNVLLKVWRVRSPRLGHQQFCYLVKIQFLLQRGCPLVLRGKASPRWQDTLSECVQKQNKIKR